MKKNDIIYYLLHQARYYNGTKDKKTLSKMSKKELQDILDIELCYRDGIDMR